jgi:hypothetical protein
LIDSHSPPLITLSGPSDANEEYMPTASNTAAQTHGDDKVEGENEVTMNTIYDKIATALASAGALKDSYVHDKPYEIINIILIISSHLYFSYVLTLSMILIKFIKNRTQVLISQQLFHSFIATRTKRLLASSQLTTHSNFFTTHITTKHTLRTSLLLCL